MKKVLLVFAVSLLGFANANAQDVKFGVKGGLNFATFTGDDTSKDSWITNFILGAMAEIKISEKFSFQHELIYSGQGYNTGIDSEGIIALNYLNTPLIAKYYTTKKLSLEAGPQIGFLLSTKGGTKDAKDLFKTTDFGVNFGLGYKLDSGLNFGARYISGLSNINDVSGFNNKNVVLQLSVGYFF